MDRMQLMRLHALLAAFILPVTIMFMVTGALYTWGVKGSYTKTVYDIPLSQPIQSDLNELTILTQSELDKLAISYPEGKPKLKVHGNHVVLEWTGSSKDVILEPKGKALEAKLTVKDTSWYRHLVQLHKAKGGTVFKWYAAIFAVSMLLLLISGFMMAWQMPKLKRLTLITTVFGVVSFFIVVLLS